MTLLVTFAPLQKIRRGFMFDGNCPRLRTLSRSLVFYAMKQNIDFTGIPALPPTSIDAEENVLGALLLDPNAYERIQDILTPQAFYVQAHRQIYKAICKLKEQGQSCDLVSVIAFFNDRSTLDNVGGSSRLAQLVDRCISAVNIDRHAQLIQNKHIQREAIALGHALIRRAHAANDSIEVFLGQIEESVHKLTRSGDRYQSREQYNRARYEQIVDAVRELERSISDPGYRSFRFKQLAERFGFKSARHLEDLYYKSLLTEENEELMTITEALDKYGNDIAEWLIHGFLPKGRTILLHAAGGVGKTLFAYDLIFYLATGQHWQEFSVSAASRRCLIVQADESANDMLQKFSNRGYDESFPIRVKTKWTVDHLQGLEQNIIDFDAEVVLIDSLTSVSKRSTFSENDVEYARPILQLRDIAQQTGCTILILHHDNKNGDARGTGAIFNSVSEVWGLSRDANKPLDSTERFLTIEKSRSRRPGRYLLKLDKNNYSWMCLGKVDEHDENISVKDAILTHLKRNPNVRFEAAELHEAIGSSVQHIRRTAAELAEDGIISHRRNHPRQAWKYFLSYDSDRVSPTIADDRSDDRWHERDEEGAVGDSDRRSLKNVNQNLKNDSLENSDRPISLLLLSPNLPTQVDLQLSKASDRESDHSLARFKIGDRCRYVGATFKDYQDDSLTVVKVSQFVCFEYVYCCQKPNGSYTTWLKETELQEI